MRLSLFPCLVLIFAMATEKSSNVGTEYLRNLLNRRICIINSVMQKSLSCAVYFQPNSAKQVRLACFRPLTDLPQP